MTALELAGGMVADTWTIRRLSANAVHFRLGKQLDWRLDLMLDAGGRHCLFIKGMYLLTPDRRVIWLYRNTDAVASLAEQPEEGEQVVRTSTLLKLAKEREPLTVELDLRLRDYASLTPLPKPKGARVFEGSVQSGQVFPDLDSPPVRRVDVSGVTARDWSA